MEWNLENETLIDVHAARFCWVSGARLLSGRRGCCLKSCVAGLRRLEKCKVVFQEKRNNKTYDDWSLKLKRNPLLSWSLSGLDDGQKSRGLLT